MYLVEKKKKTGTSISWVFDTGSQVYQIYMLIFTCKVLKVTLGYLILDRLLIFATRYRS
jgi:hypothetical protein